MGTQSPESRPERGFGEQNAPPGKSTHWREKVTVFLMVAGILGAWLALYFAASSPPLSRILPPFSESRLTAAAMANHPTRLYRPAPAEGETETASTEQELTPLIRTCAPDRLREPVGPWDRELLSLYSADYARPTFLTKGAMYFGIRADRAIADLSAYLVDYTGESVLLDHRLYGDHATIWYAKGRPSLAKSQECDLIYRLQVSATFRSEAEPVTAYWDVAVPGDAFWTD